MILDIPPVQDRETVLRFHSMSFFLHLFSTKDLPHPLFQSAEDELEVRNKPLTKKTPTSSSGTVNSEPISSRVESFFAKPRSNSKLREKEVLISKELKKANNQC